MHITNVKILLPVIGVLAFAILLYLLSPMLAPFVAGLILAYLSDPLIDRLEKANIKRGLAVALVFSVLIVVVVLAAVLLLPILQEQINTFIKRAPSYLALIDQALQSLSAKFGVSTDSFDLKVLAKEYLPESGESTKGVFQFIAQSSGALIGGVVFFMLTPIITFYLLRDWDLMVAKLYDLIPHRARESVVGLAKQSDSMLSAFIRGQLLVMTALGGIYGVGLTLIGLQFGLLVGILAGLLSFIPYLGTVVGLLIAAVLFMVEYSDWVGLWKVALVFTLGQAIEGYFLTPWLVGDKIGLHPVMVIFAVLAGGELFGFVGVLLALPVSSVLAVLVRAAVSNYKQSKIYTQQ